MTPYYIYILGQLPSKKSEENCIYHAYGKYCTLEIFSTEIFLTNCTGKSYILARKILMNMQQSVHMP